MNGGLKAAAIVDDLLTLAEEEFPTETFLILTRSLPIVKSRRSLGNYAYHFSVKIKTDIYPDLANISGSSVHLDKSLYNLISNASPSSAVCFQIY
jgi:signal transduction histidine kinase